MTQILSDELGQAFQISQETSTRIKGNQCLLNNISIVESISTFLETSLGPTGMDKILLSKDEEVTVTNDGATILKEMDMTENPISRLIVQLSESQDEEVGDGTTSVVILACNLLRQTKILLEQGVHPIKISEGFETALRLVVSHLTAISEDIVDLRETMISAARTSLSSKITTGIHTRQVDDSTTTERKTGNSSTTTERKTGNSSTTTERKTENSSTTTERKTGNSTGQVGLAEICTEAVLKVADLERKDFDFELVKVEGKIGRDLGDTVLVDGIVINKEFSHPQMTKENKDARFALLSCPFEPPKLKNKHSLLVSNSEDYKKLQEYEKEKFLDMIRRVKESGANMVLCQWGFDDEANSLLMENGLPAVRWVSGSDMGLIAVQTGASIIARFEDLEEGDLGHASIREESLGTENEKMIVIESSKKCRTVTILVRGANSMMVEEAKRSIQDALCAVRNILTNSKIVYGGGSSEISSSIFLEKEVSSSNCYDGEEELTILGFSRALESIPSCLASNSGQNPLSCINKLRDSHLKSGNPFLGVDCLDIGENDMKKMKVFDALSSKIRQYQMATQLVSSILKIDDIISE